MSRLTRGYKMKPFDIERALAGEPVVTRDGQQGGEIYYFKTSEDALKLFVVINGTIKSYNEKGQWVAHHYGEHDFDLFMAPVKKSGFINIYPANSQKHHAGTSNVYLTKKEADDNGEVHRIACVFVEWEED